MLVDLTKKEIKMLIASLMNDATTSNGHSILYDKLSNLEKVCTCKESDNYLDSLSEGYDTKVDALVDSMGVTDKKVSTTHTRKDLDLL